MMHSVLDAQLLVDERHQPRRPDHEELDVIQEGWFRTLYLVTVELPDPGGYEGDDAGLPKGECDERFIPRTEGEAEATPGGHSYCQGDRQPSIEQGDGDEHQRSKVEPGR